MVAFAEGAPLSHQSDDPDVSSIWVGVVDARATWLRLEKLPSIADRLITDRASLSALSADDIALAVPVERHDTVRVAVFVRTNGRWRVSEVTTREANYTALAQEDSSRLSLGVVHVDPSGAADHNSLWLYRTINSGESWSSGVRVVRGLGQPVHDPQFSISRGRLTVVWLTRTNGISEARASSVARADSAPVLAFGEGAAQVFPGIPLGAASIWTTLHQKSRVDSTTQLRVWESSNYGSALRIGAYDVPFDGSVGVAASDRLIVAAGPLRGASSSDPIVSLALHLLAVRCE